VETEVRKQTAFVSLGSSCQTKYQIRELREHLQSLSDEPANTTGFPFDWLVTPLDALCNILESENGFPELSRDVLAHEPREAFGTPVRHKKMNFMFWHDFLQDKKVNIDDTIDEASSKYQYLWEKFLALSSFGKRVFLLSNTLNNLDQIATLYRLSFAFHSPQLMRLKNALDRTFPAGENKLIVLTYPDRIVGELPSEAVCRVIAITRDSSRWEGNTAAWGEALKQAMGHPS
jgi:hypothetical protein